MFPHLHVHSPFSFLDGASSIEHLIQTAQEQGAKVLALTDHNSVSGMARFATAARQAGIVPIAGAEITLEDGHHLTLLAKEPAGYANLCRLLTAAYAHGGRENPRLPYSALRQHHEGLFALSGCRRGKVPCSILQGRDKEALAAAQLLLSVFGKQNFAIELHASALPRTEYLNRRLNDLAEHLHIPVVATGNVHYATKDDFFLHDLLTCIRTQTTLADIHPERRLNAENYMQPLHVLEKRLAAYPQAIKNAFRIAEMCTDAFPKGEPQLPAYPVPAGLTPAEYLRHLTYKGAEKRYGHITQPIRQRLDHELHIITQLGVESYFLIVWDLVRYARQRGIRYAGRGSAADSAVAYALHITNVDAIARGLLFERFLSLERSQMPDIDVDFDARYRDEIADYVFARYGKEHVASVCMFSTYRARSALRDLGKAMGFSPEELDPLAKSFPHIPADGVRKAIARLPELRDSGLPFARYEALFTFCEQVAGFPRHIGTHLGGLVISKDPLATLSPIQMSAKGVPIIQFDKDDIEALGLIKIDLLSLRTLSALEDAVISINRQQERHGRPAVNTESIPTGDEDTYEMLRAGETIGVFQLESPAQRGLQTRLEANKMEDIVASVALIRPGPVQGQMVEPFLARRSGAEPVTYLHPALRPILEKTYGVVLYQEQVIEIATVIAGFTAGEADKLRKTMTHYRSEREMERIGEHFITRAIARGIDRETAETIFSYIRGYAGYGFCEAHAAAFADTAYKTAYLIRHYPEHFYAAILNHYPMGFYPPNTICLAARRRGVTILPPDINASEAVCTAADGTIRIGLKFVRTMESNVLEQILTERQRGGPYTSLLNFCSRVRIPKDTLEQLILGGCFDSLSANRRALLWQAQTSLGWYIPTSSEKHQGLGRPVQSSLVQVGLQIKEAPGTAIEDFAPYERHMYEYGALGFNPGKHFMNHFRSHLLSCGADDTRSIRRRPRGKWTKIAGLVIRPHKPPTKSGRTVVFFSLEDEFGQVDVTAFENIYQKYGRLIYHSPLLWVEGTVEWRGRGVSIVARRIAPFQPPT